MDESVSLSCAAPVVSRVNARNGVNHAFFYLTCTAALAVYFLVWPVWRAQFPMEIWLTEGWNAYLQDAAAAGLNLYPAPDSLMGNNYPPLSFYAIGWLAKCFGDSLYVGRTLSIVGLLCVAGEIFFCVRMLTGHSVAAAIGALWYVAIMSHNSAVYVGTNDPQLAGQAIMGGALLWFLASDRDGTSPLPAFLLMVVAGFWKHSMIGIPLTTVLWSIIRDWRCALRPLIIVGMAIVGGFLLCGALFGWNFFWNMLGPRAYRWSGILGNAGHLQWSALAIVIWAAWAIGNRNSKLARFTALFIAVSFVSCILQWTGDGVGGNAEFDLLIALGIAVGTTFARMETAWLARYVRESYLRDLMMATLLLRLIATDRQEPALILLSPEYREYFYSGKQAVLSDVASVRIIPGEVFCSNAVICRLAGKPYVVDDFKVGEMIATGQITADYLPSLLAAHGITRFRNDLMTWAFPPNGFTKAMWRLR